jgi:hypothetical protein
VLNILGAIGLVAFGFFLGAAFVNATNKNKEMDEVAQTYFRGKTIKNPPPNPNPNYKPPINKEATYD